MTTPPNESKVHVTAETRPHPAIRKLARACILLARLQVADTKLNAAAPACREDTR